MLENMSLQKLSLGKGIWGMGLYKIIITYLAKPSFKIPADKRHKLVIALMNCSVYAMNEPLITEYSMLSARQTGEVEKTQVRATRIVRWEKETKWLLIQVPAQHHQKTKMLFVTTFAEVISDGLLAKFP